MAEWKKCLPPGPWFHFYQVTVGATLASPEHKGTWISTPYWAALTNDWYRSAKAQLLCFESGQMPRCTFFTQSSPSDPAGGALGLLSSSLSVLLHLPLLPTDAPGSTFFNQLLAHKSLAPLGTCRITRARTSQLLW